MTPVNSLFEGAVAPISFDCSGEGPAELVLVHGWCDHRGSWDALLPHLVNGARVVRLDLRGHGRSARPIDGCYAHDAVTNDLVGVIRAAGLRRPVIVGHSLGGFLGAYLAARLPEFVGGLVILDQILDCRALAGMLAPAAPVIRSVAGHLPFRNQLLDMLGTTGLPESSLKRVQQSFAQTPIEAGLGLWAPLFDKTPAELDHETRRVLDGCKAVPTTHVLTRRNDDYVAAVKAHAPANAVEVLQGSHWIHEERPADVAKIVRGLLGAGSA